VLDRGGGTRQSLADPDTSLDIAARALEALLGDILAEGRKPVEAPDMSDADAVHELRKAFKRWRALMRLIAPVVGAEAEALRLEALPPLDETRLWKVQARAIRSLEESFGRADPRALIQMATGSGKTFTAVNVAYRLLKPPVNAKRKTARTTLTISAFFRFSATHCAAVSGE
jgi:primosomal protein N'